MVIFLSVSEVWFDDGSLRLTPLIGFANGRMPYAFHERLCGWVQPSCPLNCGPLCWENGAGTF